MLLNYSNLSLNISFILEVKEVCLIIWRCTKDSQTVLSVEKYNPRFTNYFFRAPPLPLLKIYFFHHYIGKVSFNGVNIFFRQKNVFYLEKSIKKFLKNYSHLRGVWLNKLKLTSVLISLTIYMMPKSYSNIFILDFKLKETPGDGSQGRDGSAVTSSLNQSDYF